MTKVSLDEWIHGCSTVAIAGHVRPDGDCAGSTLAVYNYIADRYPDIKVDIYLEPIPNKFAFLKNAEKIKTAEKNGLKEYDAFIALDCGDLNRLGDAAGYFKKAKKTICIDHHISNHQFASVNYIFPKISSTCELIFGLIDQNWLTKEIAECLYLGIIHDTGVFQYSNTSAKTMEIAGILMGTGINFTRIVDETFYIKTFEQNKIWGKALLDSSLFLDGRCIYSLITKEDMDQFHVLPKHLDGIVSQLRSTKGVEVAIFLYQNDDSGYKISLRSAEAVDVSVIASIFGGGGHIRAAGASIKKSPEEILALLLAEIKKQLDPA